MSETEPMSESVTIEGVTFNPETGEIVGDVGGDIKLDTLVRLGKAMRYLQGQIEFTDSYRKAEIERINGLCRNKVDKLTRQLTYLRQAAERSFVQTGEKRLEYPGLGVYRMTKQRESIDDTEWSEFDANHRDLAVKGWPDLFIPKTEIRPDKKAIKAKIEAGENIPGFSIKGGGTVFEFVAEKGVAE